MENYVLSTTDTNNQNEPTPTPNPINDLANAIVTAMKQGNSELANAIVAAQAASAAPRQLTIDEVAKEPSNAARNRRTARLTREGKKFYQGGIPITSGAIVDDAEVALLHQLQAGEFINGMVRVSVKKPNGEGGPQHVFVDFDHATAEQRIALKNEVRNFRELLQRCVDESAQAPRVVLAQ
jgi:hypothetical protein